MVFYSISWNLYIGVYVNMAQAYINMEIIEDNGREDRG